MDLCPLQHLEARAMNQSRVRKAIVIVLLVACLVCVEARQCFLRLRRENRSNCCARSGCRRYGCQVNNGIVGPNTPCDPEGRNGPRTWVYCEGRGCTSAQRCGCCQCKPITGQDLTAVQTDLFFNALYFAFDEDPAPGSLACSLCGNFNRPPDLTVTVDCNDYIPVGSGRPCNRNLQCCGGERCQSVRIGGNIEKRCRI